MGLEEGGAKKEGAGVFCHHWDQKEATRGRGVPWCMASLNSSKAQQILFPVVEVGLMAGVNGLIPTYLKLVVY